MLSFAPRLYVRIHPDRLTVRDPGSGAFLQEPPLIAISQDPKAVILAVGGEADSLRGRPEVRVINPFSHPRTPISDFTAGEQLVKAMVKKLLGRRLFALSPVMVMHLAMKLEGGITQIEARALHEMGIGAGASRVLCWVGPDLTDEQVRELEFPPTGEVVA